MHRGLVLLLYLMAMVAYGQTKLFDCSIEQKRAYTMHHVQDRALNRSYLLMVSYNQVDVLILDSTMMMTGQKSYPIRLKQEKHYLTEPLDFTAENGMVYGFYANHNLTIAGFLEFNLRSKKAVRRGQLPIDLNRKDEFLFYYKQNDVFYLASGTKGTSIVKVYAIYTPKNIKRSAFFVDVYEDLHDMFKRFSEPKSMDVGVVTADSDLSTLSKKIKVYPQSNELRITFETSGGTEIIDLDLENEAYTDDIIHYRRFNKEGKTNNTNSFLIGDYHFIARSSGEEIFVYAEEKGRSEALFSGRFDREMDDIPFANEMDIGGKIWTSSSFYRNTPKDLIRDIDDGNIGIDVDPLDTAYVITVGNFKETTNPITDPYGSKVSGRNEGESSYFKVLLSSDFQPRPDTIHDWQSLEIAEFFTENDLKGRYVFRFESKDRDYVFFKDKKDRNFKLYRLD